jgi:hypothetical protein
LEKLQGVIDKANGDSVFLKTPIDVVRRTRIPRLVRCLRRFWAGQ